VSAISVVIPVYNGSKFISAALRSALNQTLRPSEIIVVDDGSTDGSADIAEAFGNPVRVIRRPHGGAGSALNVGIEESEGELLAFLDADDLWTPDKLALQCAVLKSAPSLDAVFGRVVQFVDLDCEVSEPEEIGAASQPFVGTTKIAMLVRRASFNRVGAFDPKRIADFPEWLARAELRELRIRHLDDVVAFRRIHRTNMTSRQRSALYRDYLSIARGRASSKRTLA
jgi:glycosyltransferase involved in cell wall biosynthesis